MNAIRLSRIAELTGNSFNLPRGDLKITSLCRDSRLTTANSAFFCIKGALVDGHDYALAAYQRGCRVFVCDRMPRDFPIKGTCVLFCKQGSRAALADVSAEFFGHPERSMRLIGVTGTKGKTTVARLIAGTLSANGIKTGYIGTNGVIFGSYHHETVNTTPESADIFEYLSLMREAKINTAVIEVSSQALKLNRIRGLKFDICVFTNLSPDHIGENEHPTFEDYKSCKQRLFSEFCDRYAVFNADSPVSAEFAAVLPRDVVKLNCSVEHHSDFFAESISLCRNEAGLATEFVLHHDRDACPTHIAFPGIFNASNALLAAAVCSIFGIPTAKIAAALSGATIEGRFENYRIDDADFIIDYAHNGESLRSTLTVLRRYKPARLICLFGSVGGRTKMRRADLGKVASELADFSIITSDNPGSESPESIIDEIAKEFANPDSYTKIVDRREAITYAIRISKPGDIVLLAGKGHETYQLINGVRQPFSEREILLEAKKLLGVKM